MGAGCSSLLARRSPRPSRHSLCRWRCLLCPGVTAAAEAEQPGGRAKGRAKGRQRRDDAHPTANGPCGNPLGVVVMPLQNPPDVIEAHQRYFHCTDASRRAAEPAGLAGLTARTRTQPAPVKYSYFSPGVAVASAAGRPRAARSRRPALDSTADFSRDRTLPTQHQHPSPGSPRCTRRWSAAPSGAGVAERIAERPRCRRQDRQDRQAHADRGHDRSGRPRTDRSARVARASRCSSKSASRTCRATRTTRAHNPKDPSCGRGTFGYDIEDVDSFLAKASLEKPANIPMVLACPCTLYRTEEGGWQEEVSLPLGMVVNGVFRVEASPSSSSCWLYAQTPHGHEGYVRYASCLPLGILAASAEAAPRDSTPARSARSSSPSPSSAASSETWAATHHHGHGGGGARPLPTPSWSRGWGRGPSWDTASDILPATYTGNLTDTSKAKDTRSERAFNCARGTTRTLVDKGLQFQQGLLEASRAERSVDELYLRSMRSGNTPLYAGGSIHFSSAIKGC